MKYLLSLLLLAQPLAAQTFDVIHEKTLWRDGGGKIEITDEEIVYTAAKEKESRTWKYEDIQYFDRISSKEFTILSYEDSRMLLGRDKQYHFLIAGGELSDDLFRKISSRLNKPVTNRELRELEDVLYDLPVKHLHTLGGCEGILKFTEDSIYYLTDHKKDAREWQLARDIQSIWSSDRYQLEIHVFDNNRREFSKTRVYKFDLKQPLNQDVYRDLKLRMYQLESVHLPMP